MWRAGEWEQVLICGLQESGFMDETFPKRKGLESSFSD